jgi:CheY-like chemotaxis protein
MNILIVDDDDDDRYIFCEALKELHPSANCVVCETGEDAIKFLREPPIIPDYIFLDVYMSGMDGKECLLKIKKINAIQTVPVIMYTGSDDSNQLEIYKKPGASDFICKPSSIGALRDILSSLLK